MLLKTLPLIQQPRWVRGSGCSATGNIYKKKLPASACAGQGVEDMILPLPVDVADLPCNTFISTSSLSAIHLDRWIPALRM